MVGLGVHLEIEVEHAPRVQRAHPERDLCGVEAGRLRRESLGRLRGQEAGEGAWSGLGLGLGLGLELGLGLGLGLANPNPNPNLLGVLPRVRDRVGDLVG